MMARTLAVAFEESNLYFKPNLLPAEEQFNSAATGPLPNLRSRPLDIYRQA